MEHGKEGIMVSKLAPHQNPIEQLQARFKELETGFKTWLSKQSLPVEAAAVTATGGLQGAAIGAFMGTLTNDVSSSFAPPPQANLNPEAMASLKQAQALSGGPLIQARNFAVMTGVNAGISCVMKRLRGKEDVQSRMLIEVSKQSEYSAALSRLAYSYQKYGVLESLVMEALFVIEGRSMVAAFGSGAMFSLVSGVGGPNQAANAVTSGLFFALVQGGLFKLGQKYSQPPEEDVRYVRTRNMLTRLGLQTYEKNFKKGLLTDNTLPLLNDSALRDVKIPPGPRLLILDHIQRDPELKGTRKR